MRLVTAFVGPHEVEAVRAALGTVGIDGMTVSEVRGIDVGKGHREVYRGAEYELASGPQIRIEVLCFEARVGEIVDALMDAAASGDVGAGGRLLVAPVEAVVRIRTGEQGPYAL